MRITKLFLNGCVLISPITMITRLKSLLLGQLGVCPSWIRTFRWWSSLLLQDSIRLPGTSELFLMISCALHTMGWCWFACFIFVSCSHSQIKIFWDSDSCTNEFISWFSKFSPARCNKDYYQFPSNRSELLCKGFHQLTNLCLCSFTDHWLPVYERMRFKCFTLVYKSLYNIASSYRSSLFAVYPPSVWFHGLADRAYLSIDVPTTHTRTLSDSVF